MSFSFDVHGDDELLNKSETIPLEKKFIVLDKTTETTKDEIIVDEENVEEETTNVLDLSNVIEKINASASKILGIDEKEDKDSKQIKDFIQTMDWSCKLDNTNKKNKKKDIFDDFDFDLNFKETNIEEELKTSTLNGIEKLPSIECPSQRKLKKIRKEERMKTKGKDWFNLPATEKTEEIENDLKILQMRSALDPKHFYKKNDLKVLPKYFQIGTVQHSPLDYYKERDTRRNKKHTIVDELMKDAEFQKYTKRKYKEIMDKKQRTTGYHKALKKMKKLKKNK